MLVATDEMANCEWNVRTNNSEWSVYNKRYESDGQTTLWLEIRYD